MAQDDDPNDNEQTADETTGKPESLTAEQRFGLRYGSRKDDSDGDDSEGT